MPKSSPATVLILPTETSRLVFGGARSMLKSFGLAEVPGPNMLCPEVSNTGA